jgi:O-antigen ligase
VFVLLILTGTRTSFVLLAAPTVILVGQGEGLVRSLPRAFVVTLAAVTVGVVAVVTLPEIIDVEMTQIVDRFSNLGEITGDTAAGQSFRERSVQTTLTVDAFLESPLLGVGPGRVYAWSALVSGDIKSSFVLDSPLSIPAKFGLVGLLVYLFTLGTLFRFQRRLARVGERCRVERDMVRGFLTIAILLSLLGSPVDDKGFGFVIAFLLTIGVYQILRMERELSHNASSRLDPDAVLQSGGLVEG